MGSLAAGTARRPTRWHDSGSVRAPLHVRPSAHAYDDRRHREPGAPPSESRRLGEGTTAVGCVRRGQAPTGGRRSCTAAPVTRPPMTFKIVLLAADADPSWPEKITQAVPGVVVKVFTNPAEADDEIVDADAAYGTVPPDLFARAKKLRWICAARAGLGGAWFYDALVKSDVVVTNMRGSYNEHLAAHAVAFLLAFARCFEHYLPSKRWQRGPQMIDLPTQTALIVGVGGAGGEASSCVPRSECACSALIRG